MASILGNSNPSTPLMAQWRATLAHPALIAATLATIAIVGLYFETAASIVAIWSRSDTFAHGFIVIPICLWLGWQRRDRLAQTPVQPWLPALAFIAAAGALWLVMSIAQVLSVRQFALAFMLQAAIVTIVGLRMARVLAFPLLFFLFAVPAGEFLMPTLIEWTADFTIAALRASGVPVYREGNHFVIPSGAWSVVEACSGLRYLIASMTVGTLYAAVSYRSAWRRAAFFAASILVPIIANWLRAYMIVMIGHLSNNTLAVGVDHLIYGWLFFGIVMGLLFWIGSFWYEPRPPASAASGAAATSLGAVAVPVKRIGVAAFAAVVVAAAWPPLLARLDASGPTSTPVLTAVAAPSGFAASAETFAGWTPDYTGQAVASKQAFAKGDVPVGVYIAYYRNQVKGRELVTSSNQLVAPGNQRWRTVESDREPVRFDGASVTVTRSVISGPRRLVAYRLLWIDGQVTGSDYVAKALLAWSKLRGDAGDGALIVVYAPEATGDAVAREALEALSPSIVRSLSAAKGAR